MANAAVPRVRPEPVLTTPYGRWLYWLGTNLLEYRPTGQRRPTFETWLPERLNTPFGAYVRAVRYEHRQLAGAALELQSTAPANPKEHHR